MCGHVGKNVQPVMWFVARNQKGCFWEQFPHCLSLPISLEFTTRSPDYIHALSADVWSVFEWEQVVEKKNVTVKTDYQHVPTPKSSSLLITVHQYSVYDYMWDLTPIHCSLLDILTAFYDQLPHPSIFTATQKQHINNTYTNFITYYRHISSIYYYK